MGLVQIHEGGLNQHEPYKLVEKARQKSHSHSSSGDSFWMETVEDGTSKNTSKPSLSIDERFDILGDSITVLLRMR